MLEDNESYKNMMELYKEKSILDRIKTIKNGIKAPKDSKEYKAAKVELQRLFAPVAAVVLPCILVLVLACLATKEKTEEVSFEADVLEVEEIKEEPLEEIPEEMPPPVETEVDFESEFEFVQDTNMELNAPPQPEAPASAQPSPVDAVAIIKSPVILSGIYGDLRNTGTRGNLLQAGGGNGHTEASVMRALRWLKATQNPNGSWAGVETAMTGLAVLTFLAHGEKPGTSEEFGETVQKGLEYLIKAQKPDGTFSHSDLNDYAHLIATYALSEAYGLTMNPNIKEAADKAVEVIIKGQHPTGGWDYQFTQEKKPNFAGGYRDDTSFSGWAAQALHAAEMAGFYHDTNSLHEACVLSVKGFKKNGNLNGGFGYTSNNDTARYPTLTGVGVLSMQFHGAANDPYVKNSVENILAEWAPRWDGYTPQNITNATEHSLRQNRPEGVPAGSNIQYGYYYATQAIFQYGGKIWERWNNIMWPEYTKAQFHIEKGGTSVACPCKDYLCKKMVTKPYVDQNGKEHEIGHWVNNDASRGGSTSVYDTCLAALQLMVYYRYLPTYTKVEIPTTTVPDQATTEDKDIEVITDL